MKSIVLFPSVEEATPFLMTEPRVPVFVTGSDPAEMAAGTIRAIRAKKPKLIVLAGLAASADRSIPPGSVVEVVSARMVRGTREYEAAGPATGFPEVTALTVGGAACDGDAQGRDNPQAQLIDCEGAIFLAVCEAMDMPCCCLRAVSHYRGEQPDPERMQTALHNLAEALTRTLSQISETNG